MKKISKKLFYSAAALAATSALGSAHAQSIAQSTFTTEGYFRAGTGTGKTNVARECFGLNGPGLKYRLGNECDVYGELNLKDAVKVEGIDYSINVMPTLYNPGTDAGTSSWGLGQMFVEAKGFDVAPDTIFWAGKRFYARNDVHILDTKFTVEDGVGAGAKNIAAGPGKLALAYFRDDGSGTTPASRLNIEYGELPVNPNGKLRLVTAFVKGDYTGGTSGSALTVEHTQTDALGLGGGNTFWVQYAQGSANLNTNFGNTAAGSDVKGFRITDSLNWQVGPFGGQAVAMISQNKANAGNVDTSTLGGRISYAFTKNFKLLVEAGFSQLKPQGGETQHLNKLTIAPTLSIGPSFFSRPELRLYVTTANWNAAAGANASNGLPAGKTSGTTVGAQVEIWW